MAFGETPKGLADDGAGAPPDALVDLVEDDEAGLGGGAEHGREGEQEA